MTDHPPVPLNDDEPAARRKVRSRGARNPFIWGLNLLLSVAFFSACLFAALFWYGAQQFDASGPLQAKATFTVPSGASFSSITPGLEEAGIIPEQGPMRVFTRGVQAAGQAARLKAGEFAFEPGMSMRQVMQQLTDGRAIEYSLTFPEGLTTYQMMERIAFSKDLSGPLPEVPAEGTLQPNTYSFPRGFERKKLVARMAAAQRDALLTAWESRADDLPLDTPEQMLTLASIVEKETGIASERPRVAAVFINRLRKNMRLQTDPTIIYGIWGGKGKPSDRGGLRRSEIDRETPYNTYQIRGLPPGPIASPGKASLEAVANPPTSDELYFVADGTGGHVFGRTLEEHNANVRKWRGIEAQRAKDAAAAAAEGDGEGASN
ncbi:endolytic transglycosylase MltG [Rhizobiaceae bacterium]|nr:endolytic transglycosylase MltG [Rhizobiaceae bacterium]